ncbi:MAG: transketolase [Solirubrobacterales bacterium]|nr:transketolase [Solirubrobacterales bacterium]
MADSSFLRELGQQLRVDSIRASDAAGSGHPTSSMSAADLIAVLLANHLQYDFDRPEDPRNDHLIFSKGHASPLYYSMLKAAGAITDDELLTFRRFGSRLEGHPTPMLPWVDVATGSLGQGLPIGVGVALAGKRLDQLPYRVWILCGDSEMAEGSMWEAFEHAAHYQLTNLTAIIDVNRLGQTRETMHGWDLDSYADRAVAFGWHAIEIDGHDVDAINTAYSEAAEATDKPTVIVARTVKGKGASEVENQPGKHGKPLSDAQKAIDELGGARDLKVEVAKPTGDASPHEIEPDHAVEWPRWGPDEEVATRRAYGEALAALGSERGDVVALDGEVSNSTYSEIFAKAHPDRYFEMFIAEQQMVAAAVGLQVRRYRPFASSFAAFFTRAYDFVRMAAISRAHICLAGSHAGASIGEDGPSQMALEDLAAFRAVHSSIVLYPSDPNQAASLVRIMADHPGIAYMRTHRGATPTIYGPDEPFEVGGSKVLRSSDDDQVTLVGAGVTLHEALKAADQLDEQGIAARVIDVYSVKPIDEDTLRQAAAETGAIVTVEDHWPEGGLGDAVLAALAEVEAVRVRKLAVSTMPGSGKPQELLHEVGIDAEAIVAAAQDLVRAAAPSR